MEIPHDFTPVRRGLLSLLSTSIITGSVAARYGRLEVELP